MKKLLPAIILASCSHAIGQDIQTYSVYDSNLSGEITVADATAVIEKTVNKTDPESTEQIVTAEQLNNLLKVINEKLDKLSRLERDLKNLSELQVSMAQNLGSEIPEDMLPLFDNGHEFVNLGIKDAEGNTIYWATCNVGAENPWEMGDCLAWGEIMPYYQEGHALDSPCNAWREGKTGYNWPSYQWFKGSYSSLAKYNPSDGKNSIEPEDDAASVYFGSSWHTPSNTELELLTTQCYWEWAENYKGKGVSGFVVYRAKADDDKGKYSYDNPTLSASYSIAYDEHIFLPTTGYRWDANFINPEFAGFYWSSTIHEDYSLVAYELEFSSDGAMINSNERFKGYSIRPVYIRPKSEETTSDNGFIPNAGSSEQSQNSEPTDES